MVPSSKNTSPFWRQELPPERKAFPVLLLEEGRKVCFFSQVREEIALFFPV